MASKRTSHIGHHVACVAVVIIAVPIAAAVQLALSHLPVQLTSSLRDGESPYSADEWSAAQGGGEELDTNTNGLFTNLYLIPIVLLCTFRFIIALYCVRHSLIFF